MITWFQHAEVPEYLVPRPNAPAHADAPGPGWMARDKWTSLFGVLAPQRPDVAPIGLCALYAPSHDTQEIAVLIGEASAWGQGYGEAATRALVAEAFASRQCGRVVARVRPDNTRALACYRAVGFESRAGAEDEPVWLVLTRTAWAAHPAEAGPEAEA